MPVRKKRGQAAKQREQNKRHDSDVSYKNDDKHIQNDEFYTSTHSVAARLQYRVVSGTFHQGDGRFEYPGIQCTYLSLFAMIYAQQKRPSEWCPSDVNNCVSCGNSQFLDYFSARGETPCMLLINELPSTVRVENSIYGCFHYDEEATAGLISHECNVSANLNSYSRCLADAVRNCFRVSNAGLFVCADQTVSVWKEGNDYFMFDPHSRDCNGLQYSEGNSVLVIFCSIEGLICHVSKLLLDSRRVERSSQFELVPISITKVDETNDKTIAEGHGETIRMYLIDQQKRNLEYKKHKLKHVTEVTVGKQNKKQAFNKTTYMKQYMKNRRADKAYVEKENKKEVQRKTERRNDVVYIQREKERDVKRKAVKRQDETYKIKENKEEAKRKAQKRKYDTFKQVEKERDVKRKAVKRQDETYKSKENKEAKRKAQKRKYDTFKQVEKGRDVKRKAVKRQNETYKSKEINKTLKGRHRSENTIRLNKSKTKEMLSVKLLNDKMKHTKSNKINKKLRGRQRSEKTKRIIK